MMELVRHMMGGLHVAGVAAVGVWLGACIWSLWPSGRRWRTVRYVQSLALLAIAFWLADIRFRQVARLRTDHGAELAEAAERLRRAQEGPPPEVADADGESDGDADAAREAPAEAAEPATPPADRARAYRQRGRQERAAGRQREDAVLKELEQDARTAEQSVDELLYRSSDILRMRRWARGNRRLTVALLWGWVGLLGIDYLRRLASLTDAWFPLPVAGPWLRNLFPGPPMVALACTPGDRSADETAAGPARFLDLAVRKGESFIWFGTQDPLAGCDRLFRVVVPNPRPLVMPFWRRLRAPVQPRWPVSAAWIDRALTGGALVQAVPLTVVKRDGPLPTEKMDDFLESAWFQRYAFVIRPDGHTEDWLAALDDFLRRRQTVLAATRRTVNLVFESSALLTPDRREALQFLCGETNCRLVVCGD